MRMIYVEESLFKQINDPPMADFRMGLLWSELDHFSSGGHITVGYGTEPTCRMKLLYPLSGQVWEIRCKDPEPQVRIFGRFAETDKFVATHAVYRDRMGNLGETQFDGNNWPQEIERCQIIWNQIFQGHTPHTGSNINDYISANVVEVRKLP